jgi:hypothetical protein
MPDAAARTFEQDPLFEAALELRRADDAASDQTARADRATLERQLGRVRRLAERIGSAPATPSRTARRGAP